jgi:Rad3-related DNA helicase
LARKHRVFSCWIKCIHPLNYAVLNAVFDKLDKFFPLPSPPRPKQEAALDFIWRMAEQGFRDIVVAAPTGIGKTGIGMAACLWGASEQVCAELKASPGGYYLVTQKMLQDQITADFDRFPKPLQGTGITLKSATEYTCPSHVDCNAGHLATTDWLAKNKGTTNKAADTNPLKPCRCLARMEAEGKGWMRKENKTDCPYELHKALFVERPIGVTNYAYWLAERAYVNQFPIKNVLVLDECHSIEKQLLGFVELSITPRNVLEFATGVDNVQLNSIKEFLDWAVDIYAPMVSLQLDYFMAEAAADPHNKIKKKKFSAVENHMRRIKAGIVGLKEQPDNWVYWCEQQKDGFHYMLKPLNAAPYFKKLIVDSSVLRIYLSAYPGPKNLFCNMLGLDPNKVAWKNLNSTFPIENRPIHMVLVGSMGRKSYNDTLPKLLHACKGILDRHAKDKGLIHCHSYALGKAIYDYFQGTPHGVRLLFPSAATNRSAIFDRHRNMAEPTVMLSPSMTEGFSLDDDLARFQIIAKTPFPYLGDRQIKMKMENNHDWYTLQTVMTIIQACGRIVRSDDDFGQTYILDKDFYRVYNDENMQFFPKWFVDSFVWQLK